MIEKTLRNFADLVTVVFSQGASDDSQSKSAPLWSVIFVSIIGIIAILLVLIAAYALLTGR